MKIKASVNDYLYTVGSDGKPLKLSQYDILNESKTEVIGKWDGSSITKLLNEIAKMEMSIGNDVRKSNSARATKKIKNPIQFHALQQITMSPDIETSDKNIANATYISKKYRHWIDKGGWALIEVPFREMVVDSILSSYVKHIYIVCPINKLQVLFNDFYSLKLKPEMMVKIDAFEEILGSCGAFIVNYNKANYQNII